MVNPSSTQILGFLQKVEDERGRRAADPGLAQRVLAVKRFQQARLEASYSDLLASEGTAAATRFFLDELYGPIDFSRRDAQFARIVPLTVRLFPGALTNTLVGLAELHALSERMDSEMALAVGGNTLDTTTYRAAWRHVGQEIARRRQIELVVRVGTALIDVTRSKILGTSLKALRAPAIKGGFSELHGFLQRGFDTFRTMSDAPGFIATLSAREQAFAASLFASG